jgi:hypothetical protein
MMIPTNWQGGKDYLGGGKGVNHNRPALPLRSQVVQGDNGPGPLETLDLRAKRKPCE